MAITKIQSESLNLADTYDFTGTVTGAGGVNTPAFSVTKSADQNIPDRTVTKVTWDTEIIDTDNQFASNKFTIPSAGKYLINIAIRYESTTDSLNELSLFKNGSEFKRRVLRADYFDHISMIDIDTFAQDDYLEVYFYHSVGSATNITGETGDVSRAIFSGFKIIE